MDNLTKVKPLPLVEHEPPPGDTLLDADLRGDDIMSMLMDPLGQQECFALGGTIGGGSPAPAPDRFELPAEGKEALKKLKASSDPDEIAQLSATLTQDFGVPQATIDMITKPKKGLIKTVKGVIDGDDFTHARVNKEGDLRYELTANKESLDYESQKHDLSADWSDGVQVDYKHKKGSFQASGGTTKNGAEGEASWKGKKGGSNQIDFTQDTKGDKKNKSTINAGYTHERDGKKTSVTGAYNERKDGGKDGNVTFQSSKGGKVNQEYAVTYDDDGKNTKKYGATGKQVGKKVTHSQDVTFTDGKDQDKVEGGYTRSKDGVDRRFGGEARFGEKGTGASLVYDRTEDGVTSTKRIDADKSKDKRTIGFTSSAKAGKNSTSRTYEAGIDKDGEKSLTMKKASTLNGVETSSEVGLTKAEDGKVGFSSKKSSKSGKKVSSNSEVSASAGGGEYKVKVAKSSKNGDKSSSNAFEAEKTKDGLSVSHARTKVSGKGNSVSDTRALELGEEKSSFKHTNITEADGVKRTDIMNQGLDKGAYTMDASSEVKQGKNSEKVSMGYSEGDDQRSARMGYNKTKDGTTLGVSGELFDGKKDGIKGKVEHKNKKRKLSASGEAIKTTGEDGASSSSVGGSATLHAYKGKGKDDDVIVTVNGSHKTKEDLKKGTNSATTQGGIDITAGKAKVNAGVKKVETTAADGTVTDPVEATLGASYEKDLGENKKAVYSLDGKYTTAGEAGKEDTYNLGFDYDFTSGKGKDAKSHSLGFDFAKMQNKDLLKNMNDPFKVGDPGGYGLNLGLSQASKWGGHSLTNELNFGMMGDQGNIASLDTKYDFKSDGTVSSAGIDLFAAAMEKDSKYNALFKLNMDVALKNGISLGAGGEYKITPGMEGYDHLFSAYASAGYKWKKDEGITLKMGVSQQANKSLMYIPEISMNMGKDLEVGAIGAFGKGMTPSVGGKIKHKSGVELIGGYGDMNSLMNPYSGNAGMNIQPMKDPTWSTGGGSAFIGLKLPIPFTK